MSESSTTSARGMIKSMLVIGSAQTVSIFISICRMKVLALLLGPTGIGLLSIYSSLQGVVQQAAGIGMGTSGVREIAASRGEAAALSRVRSVLFFAHLLQGVLAMLAVWLLRKRLAIWLFDDDARATEVGLIGVAVLLSLLGTAQATLLQGLRRIGDLGWVSVNGAFFGTVAGLAAVWMYGESGLILFILVQPFAAVMAALYFTRRLPKPAATRLSLAEIWCHWAPMAKLGSAFMLGGVATTATLLIVRGRLSQELGLDAAGHFAAAWVITMTYVGFLLTAMAADYFPRLTEVISDKVAAVRLMNEQAQLGLALGGPVLLLIIGLAPWVITLLYSAEFGPAVKLLQWQMVGNVFKLASWAVSFSIIAAAHAKTFLLMEFSFNIVYIGVVLTLLPFFGLEATAYAFVLGYLVYLMSVYFSARRIHGFNWEALSLGLLGLHTSLAIGLLALALTKPLAAAFASPLLAMAAGLIGLRVVLMKVGSGGAGIALLVSFYSYIGWALPRIDEE